MPNVDKVTSDEPQPGPEARRTRRRKQAVVGTVGLAVLLGAGATALLRHGDPATTAGGPAVPEATTATATTAAATTGTTATSAATATPKPTTTKPATTKPASPEPSSVAEQIRAAREAAAKDGIPLKRPLPAPTGRPMVAAESVKVTQTGSLQKDKRTLKVVSARQDLTGYRELGWVAGKGEPAGDHVRCGNNIKLSNETRAEERPNLMLCWRTSATRSVYTLTVDLSGHPSKADSVAAIKKAWSALG